MTLLVTAITVHLMDMKSNPGGAHNDLFNDLQTCVNVLEGLKENFPEAGRLLEVLRPALLKAGVSDLSMLRESADQPFGHSSTGGGMSFLPEESVHSGFGICSSHTGPGDEIDSFEDPPFPVAISSTQAPSYSRNVSLSGKSPTVAGTDFSHILDIQALVQASSNGKITGRGAEDSPFLDLMGGNTAFDAYAGLYDDSDGFSSFILDNLTD